MNREAHVELWLGRIVLDSTGAALGRIEEVEASGDEITHVLTGRRATLERLWGLHRFSRRPRGYRIRWDQLTWSASGPLRTTEPRSGLEQM